MHTNLGIVLRKIEIYLLRINYDAFHSICPLYKTVYNKTILLRVITSKNHLKFLRQL